MSYVTLQFTNDMFLCLEIEENDVEIIMKRINEDKEGFIMDTLSDFQSIEDRAALEQIKITAVY